MPLVVVLVVIAAVAAVATHLAINRVRTQKIVALADHAAPASGRFVDFEGCRIHYVEAGEGRPILFVHGLGGWLQQLAQPLFPLLDGYRLVAVDRPGSGRSTRPEDRPATIADQAAFLVRLAGALGLERPLVVGHSLGGAIALRMALDFPDRIAGLALISPLTRHESEMPPALKPLIIPSRFVRRVIAEVYSAPAAVRQAAVVLDAVFGPQLPPADYGTAGAAMAALRPSHFYAASTDAVATAGRLGDQDRRYGELRLPVGVIYGAADRVLDCSRHSASLAGQIAGLDLEICEDVGHMPHYAEPARVAAFIRRIAARSFATKPAPRKAGS